MPEYKDRTRYVCEIVGQGLGESQQKGTPYIVFGIMPHEEIIAGGLQEPVQKSYRREVIIYLTEKTQENTLRDLDTLGLGGLYSFGQLEQGHPDFVNVCGKMAQFYCRHEEGTNGKTYEKWSVALPPREGGEREHVQIQRQQIRQLDSLFGLSKNKAKAQSPAGARLQQAAAVQDAITDDDIPF